MGNPALFYAPLNGSLAFQDRAGGETLTGSGAVRYAAAEGARTNLAVNPAINDITGIARVDSANFTSAFSLETAFGHYGSKSAKIVASANTVAIDSQVCEVNLGTTVARCAKLTGGSIEHVHSVSIYTTHALKARLVPGFYDANLGFIGFSLGTMTDIPANTWTRLSGTFTNSALSSLTRTTVRLHSPGTGVLPTVYITNNQIETGSTATDYFDGASGGVWLDPITGQLGTAHASPSVSQAVAWVEEGTTNTIPDPSFENATITNYWSNGGSATISKVSTHAHSGTYGGKVSCTASTSDGIGMTGTSGPSASSGQTWTVQLRARAFASGDVGKTFVIVIRERDAGYAVVKSNTSAAFTLTDASQLCTYTVTLSGGGTVTNITVAVLNGAASAVDFVLDCVQLEQKAYATSYCDGSLGTGYAWSGTAHASSSTRAQCQLSTTVTADNRINTERGAVAARAFLDYIVSTSNQYLVKHGDYGASDDFLGAIKTTGGKSRTWGHSSNTSGSADSVASLSADTWFYHYGDWDGTTVRHSLDQATLVTATRGAPSGTPRTDSGLYIGSYTGTLHINGYIGPVLIADRPLTASERARLNGRTLWSWGILRRSGRHLKVM